MALKKDVFLENGIKVDAAYIKVGTVSVIAKTKISFSVFCSVDAGKSSFKEFGFECQYILDGQNPIKQAYEHLKTLPEFVGATDC
jgi:hypothetical protein